MDKPRILVAFLIVLTNAIGATAILPMLPIFVEDQFQASPLQATLAIGAYYAAQFVASPWLGRISDRIGRRPVLLISQMGTLVSYLLFLFAAPLGQALGGIGGMSGGLLMVYLARALDGLTGGNVSVAEAYASDISDEGSRAHALGLIGGAGGLGHILGPALAATVSGMGFSAPLVGSLVMGAVTLLLTFLLLSESLPAERRVATEAARDGKAPARLAITRPVALVFATAFVTALYAATMFSSFSLYAAHALFPQQSSEVVVRNINLLIMALGIATAVSQIFLVAPLVRRWGERAVIVVGSLLLLGSALGFSAASLWAAVAATLAYALGFALSWPSLQALVTRMSPPEQAGRQLGLIQAAFSLSFILAPIAAGLLFQSAGPQAIFYAGAGLMALATLLAAALAFIVVPPPAGRSAEDPSRSGSLLERFHH